MVLVLQGPTTNFSIYCWRPDHMQNCYFFVSGLLSFQRDRMYELPFFIYIIDGIMNSMVAIMKWDRASC